jgi:hypothetical protein
MAIHHPPVGLIHSLSLSYPPFVPTQAKPGLDKLTHRQKYEALLAASTRPAPYVLSAGLGVGGVVRSDPFSGKVSKGFWGPGRDGKAARVIWLTCSQLSPTTSSRSPRPAFGGSSPGKGPVLRRVGSPHRPSRSHDHPLATSFIARW